MSKQIFMTGLLAVLCGCAETSAFYIYKDGGTVSRTDNDYFECELEASRQVPVDTQIRTTPVYTTPVQTYCNPIGNSVQCNSYGGDVYGGQTYSYDANSDLRVRYLARCLVKRGYAGFDMPYCDRERVPPSLISQLTGNLRVPVEGSCYVAITEDAGNVVYANELQ